LVCSVSSGFVRLFTHWFLIHLINSLVNWFVSFSPLVCWMVDSLLVNWVVCFCIFRYIVDWLIRYFISPLVSCLDDPLLC
jgi:preprotein translocase subunit SecE